MVPGCMIHDLIDISAMVIPFDFFTSALLLRTCPRKATKTVAYDNSILLAKAANSRDAVEYGSLPLVVIRWPYRGLMHARNNHMPEKTVE